MGILVYGKGLISVNSIQNKTPYFLLFSLMVAFIMCKYNVKITVDASSYPKKEERYCLLVDHFAIKDNYLLGWAFEPVNRA